jgi:hypothetical protein
MIIEGACESVESHVVIEPFRRGRPTFRPIHSAPVFACTRHDRSDGMGLIIIRRGDPTKLFGITKERVEEPYNLIQRERKGVRLWI